MVHNADEGNKRPVRDRRIADTETRIVMIRLHVVEVAVSWIILIFWISVLKIKLMHVLNKPFVSDRIIKQRGPVDSVSLCRGFAVISVVAVVMPENVSESWSDGPGNIMLPFNLGFNVFKL